MSDPNMSDPNMSDDVGNTRQRPAQPVYPLMLTNLAGVRVVVVGGGVVAARKVMGLLPAAAAITVIAPELGDELRALHEQGAFLWQQRTLSNGRPQWRAFGLCRHQRP